MKKILALALTLLMALSLCSVALAAPTEMDGCEVDLGDYEFHLLPGESYKLVDDLAVTAPAGLELTNDDKVYRVSADWTIGGAMTADDFNKMMSEATSIQPVSQS